MDPTDTAANALDAFASGPGADAANALAEVFELAGDRIAGSLERAAKSGELSFEALADSILNDLAKLAIETFIREPLEGFAASFAQSFGASVGKSSGGVGAGKSGPVTVNVNMGAGTGSVGVPQASSAQIAGQVAQAIARAQTRN